MTAIKQGQLALSRLYHWEKSSPDRIALIQPMGGGIVRNFTWPKWAIKSGESPHTCRRRAGNPDRA